VLMVALILYEVITLHERRAELRAAAHA
jgi:hypothetical protein